MVEEAKFGKIYLDPGTLFKVEIASEIEGSD